MKDLEVGDLVILSTSIANTIHQFRYGLILKTRQKYDTNLVLVDGRKYLIANYHLRKV
jgi:hypothetical protein